MLIRKSYEQQHLMAMRLAETLLRNVKVKKKILQLQHLCGVIFFGKMPVIKLAFDIFLKANVCAFRADNRISKSEVCFHNMFLYWFG